MKVFISTLILLCVFISDACALSYEIIASEIGHIQYANNNMAVKRKGKSKYYYEVYEDMKVVRKTKVESLETGVVTSADTVYDIIGESKDTASIIHAMGRPAPDEYELLAISPTFVMSSRSVGKYIIVSTSQVLEKHYISKK